MMVVNQRKRVMLPSVPSSSSAWKVLKRVQVTSFWGHMREAGQTRNFRTIPAKEKPMMLVVMTVRRSKPMPLGTW